jgi:hypothetical protein
VHEVLHVPAAKHAAGPSGASMRVAAAGQAAPVLAERLAQLRAGFLGRKVRRPGHGHVVFVAYWDTITKGILGAPGAVWTSTAGGCVRPVPVGRVGTCREGARLLSHNLKTHGFSTRTSMRSAAVETRAPHARQP